MKLQPPNFESLLIATLYFVLLMSAVLVLVASQVFRLTERGWFRMKRRIEVLKREVILRLPSRSG